MNRMKIGNLYSKTFTDGPKGISQKKRIPILFSLILVLSLFVVITNDDKRIIR